MVDEAADDRLRRLVGGDGDLGPPAPLETAGKKVHALLGAVKKADVGLPEVVLAELAGQPLETDERTDRLVRALLGNHLVEGGLPAVVASFSSSSKQLDGQQIGVCLERLIDERAERVRLGRTTNPATGVQLGVVEVRDFGLLSMRRIERSLTPVNSVMLACVFLAFRSCCTSRRFMAGSTSIPPARETLRGRLALPLPFQVRCAC